MIHDVDTPTKVNSWMKIPINTQIRIGINTYQLHQYYLEHKLLRFELGDKISVSV